MRGFQLPKNEEKKNWYMETQYFDLGVKRLKQKMQPFNQGRSQPSNISGGKGGKKISGEVKYLSSFLKFTLKNRRKSAEEAKT